MQETLPIEGGWRRKGCSRSKKGRAERVESTPADEAAGKGQRRSIAMVDILMVKRTEK